MNAPLAALLAAVLAVPSFAQSDPAKAVEKAAPAVPKAKLVRPILDNAVVKQLLAGDYEQNARAEIGLAPDVLANFVVLSHKKEVLSKFRERHMMSLPSGKLSWLPMPQLEAALLDETQRIPDEVRSIGSHHLAVTHPDNSVAYYDLRDADESRPSVYKPAGKVSKAGSINDVSDTGLLHDALTAAGFSFLDIEAARNNVVQVRMKRKSPSSYVIFGKKSTQLVIVSGEHADQFWPKIELGQ